VVYWAPLPISEKVERALNASPIGWYAIGLTSCAVLPREWPLVAGLSAIPKYQRRVVEFESRQDRFIALDVDRLRFRIVPRFNEMCWDGFAPFAVGERYLHIWIRSGPHDLVGSLGHFGASYGYSVVEYDVGRVLGGGVGSEWKGSEDEGEGEHLFRHVLSPILLPLFDCFEKHSLN
jgi:hypothetical protein